MDPHLLILCIGMDLHLLILAMFSRYTDILYAIQRPMEYMAFKWFRVFLDSETKLLLAHQLYLRGRWASKKLIIEFDFDMARPAIWARSYSCLNCFQCRTV